jgi:hypothetical protein
VAQISRKTGTLRAVQLLPEHPKMDSTVGYPGVGIAKPLALTVKNKTRRAFAQFGGKLVRCPAHDPPSRSGVGASGKPGAVQTGMAIS